MLVGALCETVGLCPTGERRDILGVAELAQVPCLFSASPLLSVLMQTDFLGVDLVVICDAAVQLSGIH